MRVACTGCAGFICSNLAEKLLKDAHIVVGVDSFISGHRKNVSDLMRMSDAFTFVEGDLLDPDVCAAVCEGVEVVFHQAALGSVPRSVEDPAMSAKNNVMSTVNMLVAAKDAGVRRFVYASSASVYGNVDGGVLVETMPTAPFNPYAASKMAGEDFVKTFWRTYGLETVALRYFNVFGPRQSPDGPYAAVVPLFVDALLRGDSPVIDGDGEQARDFTHVDNVVLANILAAEADSGFGEAYNVAAGGFTTVNELFKMVAEETGTVVDPAYGPSRKGDVRGCRSNIQKAHEALFYQPWVDVREGIRRTVEWYRNEKHL